MAEPPDGNVPQPAQDLTAPYTPSDPAGQPTLALPAGPPTLPLAPAGEGPAAPAGRPASYQVLREVARGGMGVILEAFDTTLGRRIALKVLLDEVARHPGLRRRFLEEARLTGRLQHPGVPPVHDLGSLPDGRPYFTMKLVEGQTLAALLQARRDPADDLTRFVGIFEQVCQTVAYAHSNGVIHRDLKPSNVMVGAFAEVQVMDWGLAKVLRQPGPEAPGQAGGLPPESATAPDESATEVAEDLSRAGSVLGTPAFMAPEQARGEAAHVDDRADVFGLGAILCVLLTGHPPYDAPTGRELHRQAEQGDLAGALERLDGCGADVELVRLAKDCLAPSPDDRPRNAGEVARALAAYRGSVRQRLREAELARARAQVRAAGERKARRLTTALAATALLLALVVATGWRWRERQERDRQARRLQLTQEVEDDLREAERLRRQARTARPGADPWSASLAAAKKAEGRLGDDPDPALRDKVHAFLDALRQEQADRLTAERLEQARLLKVEVLDGRLDFSRAGPAYAGAFRDYGIDVLTLPTEEAGARIRASAIRVELAAALDDWADAPDPGVDRKRLRAVARLGDPDPWRLRLRDALERRDRTALRALARDAGGARMPATDLWLLGKALDGAGQPGEAVSFLRTAQARYPLDFWINFQLGTFLTYGPAADPPEAVRFCSIAQALRPHSPAVLVRLADALAHARRVDESLARYREAIALNSDFAPAHNNLGNTLLDLGRLDEAEAAYREAARVNPRYFFAHFHLGLLDELRGDAGRAIAAFRRAARLHPRDPFVRCMLGRLLLRQGRLEEAVAALRRGHELGQRRPGWGYPSGQWLAEAERLRKLEGRLPALLRGEVEPAGPAQRLDFAYLCLCKGYPAASARLYARAFADRPALAEDDEGQHRERAAGAAVRAACGEGKDADNLGAREKARLRAQALGWLKANLARLAHQVRTRPPGSRRGPSIVLHHWLSDRALAGVRDPAALAKLPEPERRDWQNFWDEVAALARRAGGA